MLVAVSLLLAFPAPSQGARGGTLGSPTLAAIAEAREATWRCQDELGVARTKASRMVPVGRRYRAWVLRLWQTRRDAVCDVRRALRYPANAIRATFGEYASGASDVAECESHARSHPERATRARNGQYEGIFQMGESERARFGHGDSALEQAAAAWRYFDASGRDWSPWACQPGGWVKW